MRVVVVVPARDEEVRIGACLDALAAQQGAERFGVVLVLDGCTDATEAVARAAAARTGLELELVPGPERGVGFARGAGMARAAERLRGTPGAVIASTDADSVVAADWLARTLARIDAGAAAVGGRIVLDPVEAAELPPPVLAARDAEAAARLRAVRAHTPTAEHHQFSGASLALTVAAYDTVGGLPAVAALEDEALERALLAAGLPLAYAADVRVTTSARTDGHTPRGLAQVLRAATWRATAGSDPAQHRAIPAQNSGAPAPSRTSRRNEDSAGSDPIVATCGRSGAVVRLGPGVGREAARVLVAALEGDPGLQLVLAAEPHPDPLAELVARPALNLHAPELAAITSPLTRTWAARRELLETLSRPAGGAADLAVLVDVWLRHGLRAIAERPIDAPPPPERADAPLAAYEILAALALRFPGQPVISSAFADPEGTRRARLAERRSP